MSADKVHQDDRVSRQSHQALVANCIIRQSAVPKVCIPGTLSGALHATQATAEAPDSAYCAERKGIGRQ